MASNVFVLDSALKRTQVKVTPGTHMRDVLEQACKARKWNPESYALKTQTNKTVDLSQPFRLSGLTGGAKLTLVQASRSPSVVNVALQLPDSEGGGRLSDKFPSTTSLWLVLRKYEDAVAGQPPKKLNLTQRGVPSIQSKGSGRLEYEQPCLHLMGRNLESFGDLQKTLAQLGLNSGSVLMRLSFKSVGQPLEEAMQEIGQYFQALDAPSTENKSAQGAHAAASGLLQSAPAEDSELDRDTPMPDAEAPAASLVGDDLAKSPQADDNASVITKDTARTKDAAFGKTADKIKDIWGLTDKPQDKPEWKPKDQVADRAFVVTEDTVPRRAEPSLAEGKTPTLNTENTSLSGTADPAPLLPPRPATEDATEPADYDSMPDIIVYKAPSNSVPAAALHEEDAQTFEPNIDHAKAHQAALARMTQNKRLLSDKELAEQAEAQQAALDKVKTVTVRVKYPDQNMIETRITSATTPSDLYTTVNNTLENAEAIGLFQLKFMGKKGMEVLPDVANQRLVKGFGFTGSMLVTVVWTTGKVPNSFLASEKVRQGPILKKELRNMAKDLKVELSAQRQEGESAHKAAMDKKPAGDKKGGKSPGDIESKMKKILGMGRK